MSKNRYLSYYKLINNINNISNTISYLLAFLVHKLL